jgi:galactokinase/mevalonate kinase-like predicted kinase
MYGGAVISCSTRERARVTVEECGALELVVDEVVRTVRGPGDLHQDGGIFDAVLAAIEYFELERAGIRITVLSDIPVRAGLSGSTAVMTALVAALLEWMAESGSADDEKAREHRRVLGNPYLLAETVRRIELYFLKIICGYQDAYMCTFGSLRFLDFRDKEHYLSLEREPLGASEDLAPFAPPLPLLLIHTGVQRVSGAVHKPVRDRWLDGDPAVVTGMLRLAHIARMAKKALLLGDWDLLGEAMTENHEIVRSLGSSSEVNERMIRAALDAGAIAAKLAGAGKGGTIIALHPEPEKLAEVFREKGAGTIMRPKAGEGVRRDGGQVGRDLTERDESR